ncbi:MAG: hypothetical protein ABI720_03310 [Actinomycetes bacterium]
MTTTVRGIVIATAIALAIPTSASAATIEPDPTFSGDGRAALNARGHDTSGDVVIDGNTSYLIGATNKSRTSSCAFLVAKYNDRGTLVRSFGNRGKKVMTIGQSSCAFSGALAADGGILVAGWSSARKLSVTVVKLRPSGSLDRSFAGDGVLKIPVSEGITWPLIDSAPDGSIWLAWAGVRGYDYDAHVSDFRVMHLSSTGRVDRGFSGDGRQSFDIGRSDFTYFSTVDANGRFYLAGYTSRSAKVAGATALLSIAPSGRSAVRTIRPWNDRGSFPLTVDVAADGKIVVGMSPRKGPGWGAARYSPTLDRDRSYGRGGYAKHNCRCTSAAGALTSQGLVLVGNNGTTTAKTAIARFTLDGLWDRAYGNRTFNLFRDWEYWVEAEVDATGRLVIVGSAKNRTVDAVIARFTAV